MSHIFTVLSKLPDTSIALRRFSGGVATEFCENPFGAVIFEAVPPCAGG
jgi:hypothetical protein